MYTECPHCRAIFRVTQAILQAAGGKVRCGECKVVFQAVEPVKPAKKKAVASPEPASATAAVESATNPELDFEAPDEALVNAEPETANDDLFAFEAEEQPLAQGDFQPEPVEQPQLEEEDADEPHRAEETALDVELETEVELDTTAEEGDVSTEDFIDLTLGDAGSGEEIIKERTASNSPEEIRAAMKQKPAESISSTNTLRHEASVPLAEDTSLDLENTETWPEQHNETNLQTAQSSTRTEHDASIEQLAQLRGDALTTPVNTPEKAKTTPLQIGLAVALILIFLAQIIILNRHTLVQSPSMSPVVKLLCGITGCEVSERREIAAIKLLSHGIYSHPTVPEALMIKAEITNEAGFDQPYPVVEVGFSDIRGRAVALRRFGPSEYLSAAETHSEKMPEGKKIPVVLEVVDPGKHALAFEFKFL